MLTGLQKAKLLLSILGDRATAVLSLLSPGSAQKLTSTIGDKPKVSASEANAFLSEVMDRVSTLKQSNGSHLDRYGDTETPFEESLSELSIGSDEDRDMFDFSSDSPEIDSGTFDGFEEESQIQVAPSSIGPVMRTPSEIADLLTHQKPQIVAFILSKMDDVLREQVLDFFPLEAKEHIESIRVDSVPLSDKVFKRIYDLIMFVPANAMATEDRESSRDEFSF